MVVVGGGSQAQQRGAAGGQPGASTHNNISKLNALDTLECVRPAALSHSLATVVALELVKAGGAPAGSERYGWWGAGVGCHTAAVEAAARRADWPVPPAPLLHANRYTDANFLLEEQSAQPTW